MRLIDADALEKTGIPFATHGGATFIALGSVRTAPTIEAEPVQHGEWAKDYDCGAIVYVCSLCGEHYWTEYEHDKKPNYCPNCGAKMDKEN